MIKNLSLSHFTYRLMLCLFTVCWALAAHSEDVLTLNPLFSDEFTSTTLSQKWTFQNPAPNPNGQSYSLTTNPGFLTMTTTGPTDLYGADNTAPKIIQSAPDDTFEIVSRVLADPDVIFEHAGILVIADSYHWVRLIRDSNQNSVYLQQSNGASFFVPYSGTDVILKLRKQGTSYLGSYSSDGINFVRVGEITNALVPNNIGMVIVTTSPGNVFSADYDYFRVFTRAPPKLYATAVSPTSIRLSWDDNFSDETGFRIQRKAGACNSANPWLTRADMGANAETFLDGQLPADTAYAYRFSIYEGAGSFSPYSLCAAATTGTAGTPQIPSILRAYSASSSRVNLRWDDVSEDETAFEIYRQNGSGGMTLLDTVAESAQSFSDTTATGNDTTTSYHYDVRACNASGCSMPAPAPVVPFKPASLKATVASTVQLTWQDKSNDESRFEIERKNGVCGSGNPWVQVGTVAANTQAYQDRSAVKGTVYAYRVRAYYHTGVPLRGFSASQAFGFSGFTGCVSATAP